MTDSILSKSKPKCWISSKPSADIASLVALVGAFVFLGLSIHFIITQRSTIDEGLYLYKGYLFAKGIYHPFQDFGPRTEYSPLSYLIPGAIQLIHPGLLTGRIFSALIGFLALLGLWAAAKKLSGAWAAAACVWAVTLNPVYARFYSLGISQGLVTCLLMATLFLAFGKPRIWQTSLSAALAGILLLTRQNMAPVLPILLAYIFWQYGRRHGLFALATGILVVIIGNLVFWPGILEAWAPWLPASLTPFLDDWRVPQGLTAALSFHPDWVTRLYTLLEGLRFHFLALAGALISLVLWPKRLQWRNEPLFRASIFLAVLFLILLVLHVLAGLGFGGINFGNAYTVNPYLAFFSFSGLLLAVTVFSNFPFKISTSRRILLILLILLFAAAVGYGSFLSIGGPLAHIRIPRIKSFLTLGKTLPGIPVWDFLSNRFGISYLASQKIFSTLFGLLAGGLLVLVGHLAWLVIKRKAFRLTSTPVQVLLAVFLITSLILSPTVLLGGGFTQWDCGMNVVQAYQQTGEALSYQIPQTTTLYWQGGNAVALLLYLPGLVPFPPQIDDRWNYYQAGDDTTLARLGLWNADLARQWLAIADVVIIQPAFLKDDQVLQEFSNYDELHVLPFPLNCEPDTFLRAFRKKLNN